MSPPGMVRRNLRHALPTPRHRNVRGCARALRDIAAVEVIAGVVDCRADGHDARGRADALLLDASKQPRRIRD